jgi:hypothetical protein
MIRKVDAEDLEAIDRLIRAEIEEGLAVFRAGDPGARLRARIAGGRQPARGHRLRLKIAVPALLAAAAGAVALVVITRPPAGRPIDPAEIEAVIGRSPWFSRTSAPPERVTAASGTRGGLETALAIAARAKDDVELKTFFLPSRHKVPSLSTEERMRILCREKVIEQALALLMERSKET